MVEVRYNAGMDIEVIFEDPCLLVVDKPSGILVHRGWGQAPEVLVDFVRARTGRRVHPMGRLDRGASGLVLFALDAATARSLQTRPAEKRYLVLVRGVAPESGVVDHPIPRRADGPRVEAVTEFRRLAVAECEPRSVSLVEAVPRTGRLHQVRRHLRHIDHPLLGDANYGKGALNREFRTRYGLARLALHAHRLILRHPVDGMELDLRSALPDDLVEPFRRMGIRWCYDRT